MTLPIYETDSGLLNTDRICSEQGRLKLSSARPDTVSTEVSNRDEIFIIGGISNHEQFLVILKLDPTNCKVSEVGKLPYFCGPSVVEAWAGSIIVFGGAYSHYSFGPDKGSVKIYDLVSNTTRQTNRLTIGLCKIATASSRHEIVVAGGSEEGWRHEVATCRVYNPAINSWKILPSLKEARSSHRLCWSSDGYIFAIGGVGPVGNCLSSVEMLERAWIRTPTNNSKSAVWQSVAPMKIARQEFGCCLVDKTIVVAGGLDNDRHLLSSVDMFMRPTTNEAGQWTSLADLAIPMTHCFLVSSTSGLILMDNSGKIQHGTIKIYGSATDFKEWTWEVCGERVQVEYCHGLVAFPLNFGSQFLH